MKAKRTKAHGIPRHHVTRAASRQPGQGFGSILDIFKYFEENPTRLIDYVESGFPTGKKDGNAILGVHIGQLARLTGIKLVAGDRSYDTLPESLWTHPTNFSNIGLILTMARAKFPHSPAE